MSKDGYYGDFESFADERQAYEEDQRRQYESECGECPNCGKGCHMGELNDYKGVVKCIRCK